MGTSQKPDVGKAVSPSVAAEPQCLQILGQFEENKIQKKNKKKTKEKMKKEKTQNCNAHD